MATRHIDKLPFEHVITITSNDGQYVVQAPMPEQYGIGISSEISSPFAAFASDGTAANLIKLASGAGVKTGVITRKLYMGPDQPDVVLDLKFEAFYNATQEVIMPIAALMLMAAGDTKELVEQVKKVNDNLAAGGSAVESGIDKIEKQTGITGLLRYLQAPETVTVFFGGIFVLTNSFVSSVNPVFSNVLDHEGQPMSAEVSITFTPQDPLNKGTVADMWNRGSMKKFS